MKSFLFIVLAIASVVIVIVSAGVFYFSVATSVGTEQDEIQGMSAAGICLVLGAGLTLGWIVYGLRGAWRVVSAVPFVLLICIGLLWILPV